MPLLKPQYRFHNVMEITPEDIKNSGATAVLIDADNTLALHNSQQPYPGVSSWIKTVIASGIPMIIISNNSAERVRPFAEKLGLPFVEKSAKPLPKGFLRACKRLGVKPAKAAVIGDQIFTDVLGGNLVGVKTVLLTPIKLEDGLSFKIRRNLEKKIYKHYNIKDYEV